MDDIDIEQIKADLSKHEYEYIKMIGKGSYAYVFLCRSLKYNDFFAVKRATNIKVTDYEYSALIDLNHHYIIQIYDIFNENDSQYMVMEYCPNQTLKQKGRLDHKKFIYYSKQILEALSFCHSKKIAHRDIKPDNIFLDKHDRIKLADFGLAKHFDKNIKSTEHCGSVMYCSPEIVKGESFDPFSADIYALGITFFFMITGKHPFNNSSLENLKRSIIFSQVDFSQANVDVNEKIKSMIIKMTSHSPKLRPLVDQLLALPIYNKPKGKTPINYYSIYSKSQIRLSTHYLLQHSSASLSCDPNYSDEAGNDQPLSLIQFQRRKNFIVNPVVSKCSLNQQLK